MPQSSESASGDQVEEEELSVVEVPKRELTPSTPKRNPRSSVLESNYSLSSGGCKGLKQLYSSLLSDLCALPNIDEDQMARFKELASDKRVDVKFRNTTGSPLLSLLLRNKQSESLVPCLKFLLQRPEIDLKI